ncbi:MAG: pentapeptide repeat-containing protein [Hyphomicrobiales bacterium]|nr:pentapeptide repeat-containing protein [Hyphomicrobiales bacterium]
MHGGPIDLHGATLFKADLRNASLVGADLRDADLIEAELGGALLERCDLTGARLVDASLIGANLLNATMTGADLTGADLTSVRNLSQAQVDSAVGDVTTQLPLDLRMPRGWIAPQPQPAAPPPMEDERIISGDLYDVLGADPSDSDDVIHAVYRSRAKSLHPDLNPGDPRAAAEFRRLTYAYAILRDPARRARYDRGEIGADGEETEEFRYAQWQAERRRRTRKYVGVSLGVAVVVGVAIVAAPMTPIGGWLPGGKSAEPARPDIVADRPPPAAPKSKTQARIEAEEPALPDLAAPSALQSPAAPPAEVAAAPELRPAEEPATPQTAEADVRPTPKTPADPPDEAAVDGPASPKKESGPTVAALPGDETTATPDAPDATASAPPPRMPSLLFGAPSPQLYGPRLEATVAPSPFRKQAAAPAFAAPASPSPRLEQSCRGRWRKKLSGFDWVEQFRPEPGCVAAPGPMQRVELPQRFRPGPARDVFSVSPAPSQ